ncbi:MAG: hypothetical protein II171_06075 [Bacteroidales bacterium]|nr:hypothetical protein [Bacteroidales bacterium]
MAEKPDILNSHFIIDGAPMPLTPARMLAECSVDPVPEPDGDLPTVADEHMDPAPGSCVLQEGELARYAALFPFRRTLPLPFAGPFTAAKVAQALIDAIWMSGHFRLGDLTLRAEWRWNDKELGNLAALYSSIESACGYIDALGVKLSRYALLAGAPAVTFKATTVAEEDAVDEEDSLFRELPYRTANPRISRRRRCAATLAPEASDWLVFIPFDPCDFRLGGSALAEATDASATTAPDVADADYFIDCYEVVREMVEDGVVKAGATVGDGGLMAALQGMTAAGTGAEICLRDVCKAYGEDSLVRVLFSEVPGVVLQLQDVDYDYFDAEFILQDVVYFPIGHPVPGHPQVTLSEKTDIPDILESILNTLEGED